MAKCFNVTADCKDSLHYMVKLDERLAKIKMLVDHGAYITMNRARQYGKTTTLRALGQYLQKDYYVVLMDFQILGSADFETERLFSSSFGKIFLKVLKKLNDDLNTGLREATNKFEQLINENNWDCTLRSLFEELSQLMEQADKPLVLMIDEVDSASNNQVFLDFLAQLRAYYINRDFQKTFQSVILAGVHDVKSLRRKLRPEDEHKMNSPWNIATDFKDDMSFSVDEIGEMLKNYEADFNTGMDIKKIAKLIYEYTAGYPYLVSKLCKLIDEDIYGKEEINTKSKAWTKEGFLEAVKLLLSERNTLFESLSEKLNSYPELDCLLRSLLFMGKTISYNYYEPSIHIATMFGFVKENKNVLVVANRIFEIWLYNYYLSTTEMQNKDIYLASVRDKNLFIEDGRLNMKLILEKFVVHFNDIYGSNGTSFVEEEGRKYFLLYLRPIINGVGNYYIESRTREMKRTDIIIDYRGEQYIIEMKIWHGDEYNNRGEQQLIDYMETYHKDVGYMISFNFNKKKEIGVKEIKIGEKLLIEAVI